MDAIAEWAAAYERVTGFMADVGPEEAARSVPATPDWTVHDLLAHMIGLDADVLAGDEPDDHNPEWTQRQVAARADVGVPELLAEWRTLAGPVQEWMRANSPRPLGDIVIHEQDLRGALGVPGGQDTDGLRAIRDRMAGQFGTAVADLAPIALVGQSWQWCSAGAPDDAAVVLRASDFDLARAVMARRSAGQLRRWTVQGDVEPYLAAFATLGALPVADLSE